MDISFDPSKQATNLKRHGLDLAEAERLLSGPCVDIVDDRFDYGEERWISIGLLDDKVAVCVWADWVRLYRVISLREATTNEQDWYYREIGQISG